MLLGAVMVLLAVCPSGASFCNEAPFNVRATSWRLIGVFCAALGAALFLVSLFCLPETLDKQKVWQTTINRYNQLPTAMGPLHVKWNALC